MSEDRSECPNDVDFRPLDAISFVENAGEIRSIFRLCGLLTAQEIIEAGCTGLVRILNEVDSHGVGGAVHKAVFVREHMGGAGFGLPCYVPPTHFCLVHNTIGGLQRGQEQRHPEGLKYCARELTEEEHKTALGMQAFIEQEGLREAQEHFGAELTNSKALAEEVRAQAEAGMCLVESLDELTHEFHCPEHKEIVYACRYCLAAAIIRGPFQPEIMVEVVDDTKTSSFHDIVDLPGLLSSSMPALNAGRIGAKVEEIEVYVRVKRWSRKLVVEE